MDMDGPFFRSNTSSWNQPSRRRFSPNFRGVPVSPVHHTSAAPSPKVVSIPVHFVRSETTRSASASKIQKVFRGYLVRKSVKKILCIKREVDEIERRISTGDAVDLIRKDGKERLRLNEALMALLFKLDSVRGVDSGVRDCRKAVIKKAIALQERVDAIACGDQDLRNDQVLEADDSEADDLAEAVEIKDASQRIAESAHEEDQIPEIDGNAFSLKDPDTVPIDNQVTAIEKSIVNSIDSDNVDCETVETEVEAPSNDEPIVIESICAQSVVDDGERGANLVEADEIIKLQLSSETAMENPADCVSMDFPEGVANEAIVDDDGGSKLGESEAENEITKLQFSSATAMDNSEDCESMDFSEDGVEIEEKANEETSIERQVVGEQTAASVIDCVEEIGETSPIEEDYYSLNRESSIEGDEENTSDMEKEEEEEEDKMEIGQNKEHVVVVDEGRDDNKRNRELLERMSEENEKMMSLMTQLFERNEMHTKMLSSLSQRVEHLEKAFVCDKLKRKKKRH